MTGVQTCALPILLGLTFANKDDYNKIQEDDRIDIIDLIGFAADKQLTLALNHADGSKETIKVNHTYNAGQIGWFKAGSALNLMAEKFNPVKKATPVALPAKEIAPVNAKGVPKPLANKTSVQTATIDEKTKPVAEKLVTKKIVLKKSTPANVVKAVKLLVKKVVSKVTSKKAAKKKTVKLATKKKAAKKVKKVIARKALKKAVKKAVKKVVKKAKATKKKSRR